MKSGLNLALAGVLVLGVALLSLWHPSAPAINIPAESTVTSSTQPIPPTSSATTTSATVTTYSSTTSASSSSTTTLPRFIPLNWTGMIKCKETTLGMMNTLYITLPAATLGDRWATDPTETISYSCDGSPDYPVDRVVYRGGATVDKNNELAGEYRLMVKCGHNARIEDLMDCKRLDVYFDASQPQNNTQA